MSVLVCQRGNRHRYAIPRMLEKANMLAALYTDSTAYSPLGRFASAAQRYGIELPRLQALASRIPTGIPRHKIHTSDKPFASSLTLGCISKCLAPIYKKWGLEGIDTIYSFYGEDIEFLEYAKNRNVKIVVDTFIHPLTNRIMQKEHQRFPASGIKPTKETIIRQNKHSSRAFNVADILLAPSQWVADGISEFAPHHKSKVKIIPYGSSIKPVSSIDKSPEPYFLFAGREPLRKGLPYLAEAASIVHETYPDWEFRVAGLSEKDITWIPQQEHLICLGNIPLKDMRTLYSKAWAFVLPSLSEGQAGVILEAMACGSPIIATKECGVDLTNKTGITIDAGNVTSLTNAIMRFIDDAEYRKKCAESSLSESKEYSIDAWKQRLIKGLNS